MCIDVLRFRHSGRRFSHCFLSFRMGLFVSVTPESSPETLPLLFSQSHLTRFHVTLLQNTPLCSLRVVCIHLIRGLLSINVPNTDLYLCFPTAVSYFLYYSD